MKAQENRQIETTEKKQPKKWLFFWKSLAALALCGTLIWAWTTSCWRATEKDVIKETKNFEIVKNDLEWYINHRKEFVRKFNILLTYPATPDNQADINNTKRQLYEKITEYDKLIEKLWKEKIDTEAKLRKYITESSTTWNPMPSTPISENRWDFLLLI